MTSRSLYLFLAVALVVGSLAQAGNWLLILELPGLVFVLALTALGLFATFGPAILWGAIGDAINRQATRRERALHVRLWNRAHRLVWAAGILAALTSIALLLSNLEDPHDSLPSFGMCLLPLFWSALFGELLFAPLESWAETANLEAPTSTHP